MNEKRIKKNCNQPTYKVKALKNKNRNNEWKNDCTQENK